MGRTCWRIDQQNEARFYGARRGRRIWPRQHERTNHGSAHRPVHDTDPVIADIFNGQTLNAFSYVLNNPLTLMDPTGFQQQPTQSIPVILDTIEQTVISDYPDDFVPEPEPEYAPEALESTNSIRFTTDVGTMGDGGAQESEGVDRREQIADLEGGYLFGVLEGLTPFAAVGHSLADAFGLSDNKSREARFGLAIGQIVGGVIATVGGIGGEVLGGAASVTGVGAALGVPVMVVSTVAVAGGIGNIAAGIRGLASVMSGGGKTKGPVLVRDFATPRTVNRSAKYASEREARAIARTHLGKDPVKVGPGKLRSQDGRWQYRGKPDDLLGHSPADSAHIHLEKLDPKTGEVLENWHLRW
jgi:hypothetical protein